MGSTSERFIPGMGGQIELEHYNRYYFVINQIDLSDKVVLDIASGEGYGASLMARNAKFVYGVDISSETIQQAKRSYANKNLDFILGRADEIPLENDSIDVCVSFETIEHHDRHQEMISEIKRVLKKNGVLVISSPDKLNYSDIPNFHNQFHVKELYFEEFKSLIEENFKCSYFFCQRFFVGSIIAFDGEYYTYQKPIIVNKDGDPLSFTPTYNIAIATNNDSIQLNHLLILYKENDNILTNVNLQIERNRGREDVYSSLPYRLGFSLVRPLKRITKMFKTK